MKRKLVSIQRVQDVTPIVSADAIECIHVLGWKVVSQKGNFKPGDLCVYHEIDSFLPELPVYEFLRKGCFKSTAHLGDGFRLRTIKLKGQVSQGLCLPLSEFQDTITDSCLQEGLDLTEKLGIKKWEAPISPQLAGKMKGSFPVFIKKTDQERIQNCFDEVANLDEQFEVTLKLDGSSCTAFLNQEGDEFIFGVCSRNIELQETEDNTFWKAVRSCKLLEAMQAIGRRVAVQAELMGPGIQGNREKFKEHELFLFDVFDIENQRYLTPVERQEYYSDLLLNGSTIKHVPVLFSSSLEEYKTIDDFLNAAEGESINHSTREGIVFKSFTNDAYGNRKSFKVISNKFLLKED